jgi:hypothetical protein
VRVGSLCSGLLLSDHWDGREVKTHGFDSSQETSVSLNLDGIEASPS